MQENASITHHQVELPTGLSMHYARAQSSNVLRKERIVVVLLHGFPDTWYGWRRIIGPLAARTGFEVIAPDLRGYGDTLFINDNKSGKKDARIIATHPSTYRMEIIAQDVCALLDSIMVERAIIIGHDWGGTLAWNFALHHKDRTLAVGVFCTPFYPSVPNKDPYAKMVADPGRFEYQVYFQNSDSIEEFDENPLRSVSIMLRGVGDMDGVPLQTMVSLAQPLKYRGMFKTLPKDVPIPKSVMSQAEAEYYAAQFSRSGFLGPISWYRNVTRNYEWNLKTVGMKVTCPSLMVTAELDHILKPEMTKGMEEYCTKLSRGHVEGANHWVLQEKHKECVDILADWMNNKVYKEITTQSKL